MFCRVLVYSDILYHVLLGSIVCVCVFPFMVVLLDSWAVTGDGDGDRWLYGRVTRGDPLCASHALTPCAWYPFVILIASMRDSGMRGDAAAPIDNDGTRTQPPGTPLTEWRVDGTRQVIPCWTEWSTRTLSRRRRMKMGITASGDPSFGVDMSIAPSGTSDEEDDTPCSEFSLHFRTVLVPRRWAGAGVVVRCGVAIS